MASEENRCDPGTRIEILIDLLLSGILDVLIELGHRGIGQSLRPNRRAHPVLSGVSAFLLGCIAGGVANVLWPVRIFAPGPIRGLSVVVTPILNGALMHWYGAWRERRGHERFFLATSWGGALLAFGLSLVRFLTIGGT